MSDKSSTDSECTDIETSSIASDQDRFDTAYDAFRDLANDLYHIDLRMSHAIVSARYSAKIQVRCVAVCGTSHCVPLDTDW